MAPTSLPFSLGDYVSSVASVLVSRSESSMSVASKTIHELVRRDDTGQPRKYNPGKGTRPPESFDNKGYFALFGLLGAAMVLASIWFFFWAKNGGFVWRTGDWDDYKSTVLRRKDKNGKTLSNATKTTYLGEKSIAGTFDVEKNAAVEATDWANVNEKTAGLNRHNATKSAKRPKGHPREPSDEDVRAYRHEKAARVGGINRMADGSHFDLSSSDRSSTVSDNSTRHLVAKEQPAEPPKRKGILEKTKEKNRERKREKQAKKVREQTESSMGAPASAAEERRQPVAGPNNAVRPENVPRYSNVGGSPVRNPHNSAEWRDHRPTNPPRHGSPRRDTPQRYHSPRQSRTTLNNANPYAPRQPSPIKNQYPGSFDAYSDESSDTGTRSYTHHIPELARGSRDNGFRRGGRLDRRDSLSDNDGDLGTRRF